MTTPEPLPLAPCPFHNFPCANCIQGLINQIVELEKTNNQFQYIVDVVARKDKRIVELEKELKLQKDLTADLILGRKRICECGHNASHHWGFGIKSRCHHPDKCDCSNFVSNKERTK